MEASLESNAEICPTKQYNELGDPKPRGLHWILGGLALFAVIWAGEIGQSATTGLRFARLQQEFLLLAKSKTSLARLLTSQRYKPLFTQHAKMLRTLHPLFGMVEEGELGRALKMMTREETPKHPLLVALSGRLRAIEQDDDLVHRLKQEDEFSRGTAPALWSRYVDLRVKTAQLLSARPAASSDTGFDFYTDGVLRGLPKMSGIPESLQKFPDVIHFVPALRNSTAEERWRTESQLQGLKESGIELHEQIMQHAAKSTKRADALNGVQKRHQKATREARILLRNFAIELTRQTLPLEVRQNYAFLRQLAEHRRVVLPDLMIEEHADTLSEDQIAAVLDAQVEAEAEE